MSRKVLHIAGFLSCGAFQKAKSALVGLSTIYPSKLSVDIQECKIAQAISSVDINILMRKFNHIPHIFFNRDVCADATRDEYMLFLDDFRAKIGAENHKTSPIVWTDEGKYLGGRDDTIAWAQRMLGANAISGGAVPEPAGGTFEDTGNTFFLNVGFIFIRTFSVF